MRWRRRLHPEQRVLARVLKDRRESVPCIHPSRRPREKRGLLRMRRARRFARPRVRGAEDHNGGSADPGQTRTRTRTKGNTMRLYLAGPLGFSEAGRSYHEGSLVPEIKRLGYEVLDPWKLTDPDKINAIAAMPYGPARRDAWRKLNVEIGGNNRAAIDDCDFVLAVLDGVDVDSGTASEIGYAFAKGKRIVGYRGDFRLSADNEGSTVNLQVEYFIRQSGGEIVTRLADLAHVLDPRGSGPARS
jgi:nucleoside 2-deoxyribosyltransferase